MKTCVEKEMINHCKKLLPYEACGLLSGKDGTAKTVWMMDNVIHSPVAFEMDPEQIRNVLQRMSEKGEELVGIYHSHPTAPAIPSEQDILYAYDSHIAYLIVSFYTGIPTINGFCIQHHQVTPLAITLSDE